MIIKTVFTVTAFSEAKPEHYKEVEGESLLDLERALMSNPKYANQAFAAAIQSGKAQMTFELTEHKENEE